MAVSQGNQPGTADNNKLLATLVARDKALASGLVKLKVVKAEQAEKPDFNPAVVALSAIERLSRSVTSHKGQATRAKKALAEAQEREPGDKARAIGPLSGDPLSASQLLEAIDKAEVIEVVASDGKKELLDVPPLRASGVEAFKVQNGRLIMAIDKFIVACPPPGKRALQLEGWGLVLDGELVAYRDRGGTMTLGNGMHANLAGDPLF
jgi:hypothetical protein